MRLLAILGFFILFACGCRSARTSTEGQPLRSEREYAERSEAVAQDLYKTGQAPSIEAARAQATAAMNQEWASAAKATKQKQNQDKFEKDLAKMKKEGN